jgi:hypothetical protein
MTTRNIVLVKSNKEYKRYWEGEKRKESKKKRKEKRKKGTNNQTKRDKNEHDRKSVGLILGTTHSQQECAFLRPLF